MIMCIYSDAKDVMALSLFFKDVMASSLFYADKFLDKCDSYYCSKVLLI